MAITEERECSTHGLTIFVHRPAECTYRCRKCATASVTKRRIKVKQKAIDYMGGSCQCCGYDKYAGALEFHHKDPKEKDFGIAKSLGWEKIKVELDKCIMLCANCHREVHAGLIQI